jgi:hypothetical protein
VDWPEIERKLQRARVAFMRRDRPLLKLVANERSMTHKFAECLQKQFRGWRVDCEYDQDGDPKQLPTMIHGRCRAVRPDIVVHRKGGQKPGEHRNLLIVKVKKPGDTNARDRRELKSVKTVYGSSFAVLLRFVAVNDRHRNQTVCGSTRTFYIEALPEESQKPPPPSFEANWEEFTQGLPGLVDAINDGMDCIVHQAHEMNTGSGPQMVIAMLTGSLAENLYDIMFLCENERRDGAMRLLRTPYEKYLYAHYISAHPETAEDFVTFDAIQSRALMTALEQHHGYKMSDLGKAGLDQMVKAAQIKLSRNKCPECGESLPRMWTKVTPEQMAKDAGLQKIHVLAYRYATLFIHPSWRGVSDQVEQSIKLPSIVAIVHRLVFETVKLQWLQFKKTEKISGRTAEVLNKLGEVGKL